MKKALLAILIFLGVAFQLITVFRSGSSCLGGICFWGPNGHDGVWHLGLINQFEHGVPPLAPTFAGERLKNYHWGYDFLVWLAHKISTISILDLHFRLFPLALSLFLGILSFKLAILIDGRFWTGFWFVLLNYFANSLGWLVTLIRDGSLGGESLFWAMQSISFLLNPPFALSVVVLFFGLYLWKRWENYLDLKRILVLGLIFGSLLNIKAYAAALFVVSLATLISFNLLKAKNKRVKDLFRLLMITGLVSGAIWFFWQRGGNWPFVFQPLWFVRGLFESYDRLYLPWLAKIWWLTQANWYFNPKFFLLVVIGLTLFVIGNFNTRLLGLLVGLKRKEGQEMEQLFFSFVFWGTTIPLFFIQKGTAWNTIQFLYYALLFSNWFLARFLADLTKRRCWAKILLVTIPLLPANYGTLRDYFGFPPPAIIVNEEIEGLRFLSSQPGKIVLTFPYNQYRKLGRKTPLSLHLYESTAYVSAFSGKISFLEDEMNLEITGFPWRERREEIEQFFASQDSIWSRGFLLNNKIDYIYLVDGQQLPLASEKLGLKMIFENEKVRIYQVLK